MYLCDKRENFMLSCVTKMKRFCSLKYFFLSCVTKLKFMLSCVAKMKNKTYVLK